MNSVDAFPYTIRHASELLKMKEAEILSLCNRLNIQPRRNERNGMLFLSQRDLDTLGQTIGRAELSSPPQENRGQPVQKTLPVPSPVTAPPIPPSAKSSYSSSPQKYGGLSRTELSVIVDSVSNAKEEILKDLSQLLDDKLSGLDEIVVELIRSKSENDSLKEELKRMEDTKDRLQSELSRFKPAAFGFYRKEG